MLQMCHCVAPTNVEMFWVLKVRVRLRVRIRTSTSATSLCISKQLCWPCCTNN